MIHIPFFEGDKVQVWNCQRKQGRILAVESRKASITGAWYKIAWDDGDVEYTAGYSLILSSDKERALRKRQLEISRGIELPAEKMGI